MANVSVYKSSASLSAVMAWYSAKLGAMPVQTECREVSTYAGQTHIIVAGDVDAPPLMVLHGMNMNGPAMAGAIAALSETHRVYAIDIIGMPGKSAGTRPPRAGNGYPRWLMEVMEQLSLQCADFLGFSFGGWLILKLATLSPERINKAVLLDSGGLTPFTFKGQALAGWYALWYILFPTEKNLIRAAVRPFYAPGCDPDPDHVQLIGLSYRHVKLDIDPKGLPPLTKDQLAGFSAPTMVVYGEKDLFFNAARGVEKAKEIIPNLVTAEIITGQGHIMDEEAHSQVYGKIRDFFTRCRGNTA